MDPDDSAGPRRSLEENPRLFRVIGVTQSARFIHYKWQLQTSDVSVSLLTGRRGPLELPGGSCGPVSKGMFSFLRLKKKDHKNVSGARKTGPGYCLTPGCVGESVSPKEDFNGS